ncbi:class 1 isoprenoid biosynthesis enzyme [Exiguobacterium sp. SH0S1]|uniref:class 1 isoprenoid biosynthesis enzyme n=1 Tax=Exiguobacterium sp. SH0S1 TaxID=2510949 RepID=UPI001038A4E7|nr:class 1 isoprenoid biosynthesis enzyme [Exiguobacterium sp. SH0S1]TCI77906.1 class 1 isoprenoid biosynthesis enzyme [Exiguobacterium sp. SH0S1]
MKWVQRDFNKKIAMLEQFKLRRHLNKEIQIDKHMTENDFNLSNSSVDRLAEFVISMYTDSGEVTATHLTIGEEADYVTQSFSNAYFEKMETKGVSLFDYFAIPELEKNEEAIKALDEQLTNIAHSDGVKTAEIFKIINRYIDKTHRSFWKPKVEHYAVAIWYIIYECVEDLMRYSDKYQVSYVEDGEQRCLFNYFNLYIHGVITTGKLLLPENLREVMFAASAIHPAQDDFIDRNRVTEEMLIQMEKKIKGEEISSEFEDVNTVFRLIDIIYKKYPVASNPELVEILLKLHEWQIHSLHQQNNHLSEEEIIEISLNKGGYAFAFYGYIALGELDKMAFRHFFGMGAIFQLMDDLHDIEIDLREDINTIWSMRIKKGVDLEEALYGLVGIQQSFEKMTTLIPSLKRPVFFRRMELFAVRLDFFKFYLINRNYFNDDFLNSISAHAGVDFERISEKYKVEIDTLATFSDFKDILLTVKTHFMNSK